MPPAATSLPLPPPVTDAMAPVPSAPTAPRRPVAAPPRVQAPAPAPPTGPARQPAAPGTTPPASNLYLPSTEALATGMRLKPAPTLPTDRVFPINLATALRLSDARPLVVAAAQTGVWIAEAELTRAKVLWVPSVIAGVDYTRHDGGAPPTSTRGSCSIPALTTSTPGPGPICTSM